MENEVKQLSAESITNLKACPGSTIEMTDNGGFITRVEVGERAGYLHYDDGSIVCHSREYVEMKLSSWQRRIHQGTL